jgi:cyclohexanone monooxygenase
MGVNHSTLTPNFPHLLKEQAAHIAHIVGETELRQGKTVEPTPEAEAGWVQTVKDTARLNLEFRQACTPGYYNGEGRAGAEDGLFAALYGPGPVKFFELIRAWRDGGMEGLEIR